MKKIVKFALIEIKTVFFINVAIKCVLNVEKIFNKRLKYAHFVENLLMILLKLSIDKIFFCYFYDFISRFIWTFKIILIINYFIIKKYYLKYK